VDVVSSFHAKQDKALDLLLHIYLLLDKISENSSGIGDELSAE
jgi:hypothetical protein